MWIFTNKGAVSIVQDWKDPLFFWVRSRKREHLVSFATGMEPYPSKRIEVTPNNDYAFRVKVSLSEFQTLMVTQPEKVDYTNFKNSIKDNVYHHACSKIWSALLDACNTGCYAAQSSLFGSKKKSAKAEKKAQAAFNAEAYFKQQQDYYDDVFKEKPDDDRTELLNKAV